MSKKSKIFVFIQFACFTYFIFSDGLIAKNIWIIIQGLGFVISVWGVFAMKIGNFNVQPEVKPTAKLVTNGPYKIIRNPMYVGLILFFGTSVLYNFSYFRLFVFTLLVFVFLEKINLEEQFLTEFFNEKYAIYKKNTYRLIPFVY
jgi:protein-S-isoprenylcysteine O-methyltransferase Ste14